MKCQILFTGKIKKDIPICRLLKNSSRVLSVIVISKTATILQVIQKLVQLDEAQTRLKKNTEGTRERNHGQKNEMRKLIELFNKTLEEVENQKSTVKGKLIERINDLGPTENAINTFSSPEQKLRVGYCDHPLSVVSRRLSFVVSS